MPCKKLLERGRARTASPLAKGLDAAASYRLRREKGHGRLWIRIRMTAARIDPRLIADALGDPAALAYFESQMDETREFWARFGAKPDFRAVRALDLGCGHGALSLDMAKSGAAVLGLDLDTKRIAFARGNLQARFPELKDRVRFEPTDLVRLAPVEEFDLIVSKDTFEHLEHLDQELRAIRQALRPGGRVWAGFSPLYFSPRGDHTRAGLRLPWLHVALPEFLVLAAASHHRGHPVRSLADIGLNGMTPQEFRSTVSRTGLRIVSIRYNAGDKWRLRALAKLRRLGWVEKYATVGVYCVLARASDL